MHSRLALFYVVVSTVWGHCKQCITGQGNRFDRSFGSPCLWYREHGRRCWPGRMAVDFYHCEASHNTAGQLQHSLTPERRELSLVSVVWLHILHWLIFQKEVRSSESIKKHTWVCLIPVSATLRGLFGLLPPFLTAEEATLIHARIERDRGDSVPEKLTVKKMLICAKDWKIWEFSSYVMFNVGHCWW